MVFGKHPGVKNHLRISSSLQDLSSYRYDLEHGPTPNNFTSSFSKTKPVQLPNPVRRKHLFLFPILILLLFLLLFFLYTLYSHHSSPKYYVVLDCGSTGTRVYVYRAQIQNNDKKTTLPISIQSLKDGLRKNPSSGRAYDRMETEPGLDKLLHNRTGLKTALVPLLKWAQKQIPETSHKTTSLFLYATAGVRRLPFDDSKWLLDNAWSFLKSSSPFVCKRDWVKIISGTEEAYFGWIALNYDSGILGVKPRRETYGALDLGGSSLQVTFEGNSNKEPQQLFNSETSLYVRIGSVNHHLTAYSLAGYGLNEAFDKSVAHVFKEFGYGIEDVVKGNLEVKHPCLQIGYKERYSCSHCSSAVKKGGESLMVEGNGNVVGKKEGGSRTVVTLVGAPNWLKCSTLAKVAVNLSEWSDVRPGLDCEVHPCALRGNLPQPMGHFYVISGFFVVYRFFNLTAEATLEDVLEKGREFCDKRWDVARKSVAPQPFIEQYCFRAPYIASLVREGLHITDKHITVGSGSITWTLGVALLEAGKAYSVRFGLRGFYLLQMKMNPLILIPILILSFILLLCALSWVVNWMPRFFRRQYLPFFRHNSASSASGINIPSPFRFQRWSPMNSVNVQNLLSIMFAANIMKNCSHYRVQNPSSSFNVKTDLWFNTNSKQPLDHCSPAVFFAMPGVFSHTNCSYAFSADLVTCPHPGFLVSGDGRTKTPLSPTIAGSQDRPFSLGHGLSDNSGNIQLMESSFHPSASSVSHSYSSNNLGQMQFDSSSIGAFWSPHRSQMHLQSRRSQSREDLNSSLAETHMVKA
ncbi:putative apyrase 7 [Glycine soja]